MAQTLSAETAAQAVSALDGWTLSDDGASIARRWTFRDFAGALDCANRAGRVAEARNHHPDIRLGWGYCEIRFTTHDAGGLTQADLDAAAALDAAMAAKG